MMNFNSQICTTKEQSERLIALGLKKETADCFLEYIGLNNYANHVWHPAVIVNNYRIPDYSRDIPAWSLDSLLNLLPINIEWNNNDFDLMVRHTFNYIYHNDTKGIMISIGNSNRYESAISLIEWLIREGYFNKEYLKD